MRRHTIPSEKRETRLAFLLKWLAATEARPWAGPDAEGVVPVPTRPVRRNFAGAVGIFIALALVTMAIIGFTAANAKHNPPRINISRSDYEQALAKWRAQAVDEYVITLAGTETKMRVSNGGRDIVVLSPLDMSTPTPRFVEYLKSKTVEGMFAEIEKALASDGVMHFPGESEGPTFYIAYTVRFHPELGYPTYLEGHPATGTEAVIHDIGGEIAVKELTIIRQGTPAPTKAAP
ncbi:MAG TPA: hypothetical protein VF914_07135 [Chloroflexia bacterium]|jgi:hypothetical protein